MACRRRMSCTSCDAARPRDEIIVSQRTAPRVKHGDMVLDVASDTGREELLRGRWPYFLGTHKKTGRTNDEKDEGIQQCLTAD